MIRFAAGYFVVIALLAQSVPAAEHAIYKSVDRGVTWERAGGSFAGSPRINSFGAVGSRVFAGTDAGIYSSDDEGETWRKTSATARTISFATSGSTIYAGTHSAGLLASHDQGRTWNSLAGLASKNIRSLLAIGNKLIAGTDADGVMVSYDSGKSWAAHNAGLPQFRQIFSLARVGGTVFAGLYNKGLYAWSENAPRWELVDDDIKPLALAAANGSLAAGHNPGGIYWSLRPTTTEWSKAIGEFKSPAPVREMAAGDRLVVAGVADGLFRSDNGGRTWSRAAKGLPARSAAVSFLVRGDTVFAGIVITDPSRK